jgi:hypothetical protein
MIMAPQLRKFALTAHVVSSVGSLGAVAGFFALAVAGLTSQDSQLARAVYPAMELLAQAVIFPLVIASLATGLVQALGTTWGLFQHYWVLLKFFLTIIVAIVLLLQMEGISYLAAAAVTTWPSPDLGELRVSLVVHAGGGLVVLLINAALSVYKPRGMTRYGWRKQHQQRA